MPNAEKKDQVQVHAVIVSVWLPAEFRKVARLANKAGLEGYEVVGVDYGLDMEAIREKGVLHAPTARVEITYRRRGGFHA
jgi:hypothetical protein